MLAPHWLRSVTHVQRTELSPHRLMIVQFIQGRNIKKYSWSTWRVPCTVVGVGCTGEQVLKGSCPMELTLGDQIQAISASPDLQSCGRGFPLGLPTSPTSLRHLNPNSREHKPQTPLSLVGYGTITPPFYPPYVVLSLPFISSQILSSLP